LRKAKFLPLIGKKSFTCCHHTAGPEKAGHKHDPDLAHVILLSRITHVQFGEVLLLGEGNHLGVPHRGPRGFLPAAAH